MSPPRFSEILYSDEKNNLEAGEISTPRSRTRTTSPTYTSYTLDENTSPITPSRTLSGQSFSPHQRQLGAIDDSRITIIDSPLQQRRNATAMKRNNVSVIPETPQQQPAQTSRFQVVVPPVPQTLVEEKRVEGSFSVLGIITPRDQVDIQGGLEGTAKSAEKRHIYNTRSATKKAAITPKKAPKSNVVVSSYKLRSRATVTKRKQNGSSRSPRGSAHKRSELADRESPAKPAKKARKSNAVSGSSPKHKGPDVNTGNRRVTRAMSRKTTGQTLQGTTSTSALSTGGRTQVRLDEEEEMDWQDITDENMEPESELEACFMCNKTSEELGIIENLAEGTTGFSFDDHVYMCMGVNPNGLFDRCPWCLASEGKEVAFHLPQASHAVLIKRAITHYRSAHDLLFSKEKSFAGVYLEQTITGKLGIIDPMDIVNFNRSWGRDMGYISINSPVTPMNYRIAHEKLANAPCALEVSYKATMLDGGLMLLFDKYCKLFKDYFKCEPVHFEMHATSASNSLGAVIAHFKNALPSARLRKFKVEGEKEEVTISVRYVRGSFGGGFGVSAASSYLRTDAEGGSHLVVPNGRGIIFDILDLKKMEAQVRAAVTEENCGGIVVEMVNNQGEILTREQWKALAAVCKRHKILLIVDECLTAIRCGYPMAWHNRKYSSIARPDMVIFGKALLVSGIAVVSNGTAFGNYGTGASKAVSYAVSKWRPKVTCMLPPHACLTASVALSTAIDQNWAGRARVIGAAIKDILDNMPTVAGRYKSSAAMFYINGKVDTLPFVPAPAGKVTRLFPPLHLNNHELGALLNGRVRELMLKGLDGQKPLFCFGCGDGTDHDDTLSLQPERCGTCGWYRCENCVHEAKAAGGRPHNCVVGT